MINYSICVQCLGLYFCQQIEGFLQVFPQTTLLFETISTVPCLLHDRLWKESFSEGNTGEK